MLILLLFHFWLKGGLLTAHLQVHGVKGGAWLCQALHGVTADPAGVQGCAGGCRAGVHQVGPVGRHAPRSVPARLLRHPGATAHPGASLDLPSHVGLSQCADNFAVLPLGSII